MTDLEAILEKGGAGRIALLQYCVMSVTMEPIFVFLVREYRLRPTHAAALALYDVFCAPDAMAHIAAPRTLPPRDLRLAAAATSIRRQWVALQSPQPEDESGETITTPFRNLFDGVVETLRNEVGGRFAALALRYDPTLEPLQQLPGGRMNAGQRHFVDKVWKPHVRPHLVAAGFWQIATIE